GAKLFNARQCASSIFCGEFESTSFCSVSQTGRKIPAPGLSAWQLAIHQLCKRFRKRVKRQCKETGTRNASVPFAVTAIARSLCDETRSDESATHKQRNSHQGAPLMITLHLTFTFLWKRPN